MNVIFFGSTSDSVLILSKLFGLRITNCELRIAAVITQPPKPIGRDQILTPTPVALWAEEHKIPVLTFRASAQKPWEYDDGETAADTLAPFKADLIISASYGLKIPGRTLREARFGGLNIHPSILPRWRGADPVPWAILSGDHQTGVTVVTLNERFDGGNIIAQKKIPITDKDTSDPLRTKLFAVGAELLVNIFPTYLASKGLPFKGSPQDPKKVTTARKFTRDDGYIPWELLKAAMEPSFAKASTFAEAPADTSEGTAIQQYNNVTIMRDYLKYQDPQNQGQPLGTLIERFFRALSPWPGLWTEIEIRDKKRLKILSCHLSPVSCLVLDTVQLEGKKPVSFAQFNEAYHLGNG
jgi:methionyl-tRNA formyltransferase